MTTVLPHAWVITSFILHLTAAVGCGIAAGWLIHRGDRDRPDRNAAVATLCLNAVWAAMIAALGSGAVLVIVFGSICNLAWIMLLYRLFANDGRDRSMGAIRPVVLVLAFVELLQPALLVLQARYAVALNLELVNLQIGVMFRILVAVGALVLLHNLYVGASAGTRKLLRWSAVALAVHWTYELNFYTIAYLSGELPVELSALSGLATAFVALLLAIGANQTNSELRLRPSRAVTFQTLSLLVIGLYFLIMIAIAQSLAVLGGDFARLTQVGFVVVASLFAILWLPSTRLRGWLRVTMVKHLFQHRYDYRAEWLRFTRTIGQSADNSTSLFERAVKSLADITDSPAGLLLLPGESGNFELAARWQWPDVQVPAEAISAKLANLFESSSFILDMDDVQQGRDRFGEAALLPDWLQSTDNAWALVPLLHFDRLTGVIVLSRPSSPRKLDWEDFDLLRVVGQQLASYLAEQSGHEALMEAARFEEFNRRIAFVMHDIKNLASQLALLARNAERHAEKPEFRADMLVTLRNSAEKLNALLARLGRYGAMGKVHREPIDLGDVARSVAARFEGAHRVAVIHAEPCIVEADPEGLEQALAHLVQNAVDASDPDMPVFLDISSDGIKGRVIVADSGVGMSPEFIRNGLFKPFVSSKAGGFGIGAFEARELIRAMGGWLDVESREDLGTRFSIQLRLAAAVELLARNENSPGIEVV